MKTFKQFKKESLKRSGVKSAMKKSDKNFEKLKALVENKSKISK